MDNVFTDEVKYWSDKLEEATKELNQIRTPQDLPHKPLSIEEAHQYGELLQRIVSYSALLKEAVDSELAFETKPLWKRIFKK